MKLILFILLMSIISPNLSFGQTTTDSISMRKVSGSYKFYQNQKRLSMSQALMALGSNEVAYKHMNSAVNNNAISIILGATGGFMVGWTLGTAIAGGDANWALGGIGAGLIVVSIPISQKRNKDIENAIETFNKGLNTSSFWDKKELDVSMSSYGIGLTLKF